MSSKLEALLEEAIKLRVKRFKDCRRVMRRMFYELGFRDGWKAALSGRVNERMVPLSEAAVFRENESET